MLLPMKVTHITPVLNVSDLAGSFAWFEKWSWKKLWEWGSPPGFGAVQAGECEIYLCQGGQGSRGRGSNTYTFGADADIVSDKGVWVCVMVDDVDEVHRHCISAQLDITFPPTNMDWGIREMHVRHPDGHVFRVGTGTGEEEEESPDVPE